MKGLILALSLLVSGSALADMVVLAPQDCGITKQCVNVPNDQAADVDLYLAPQYPWLNVYVDGVHYYAPAGNGITIENVTLTEVGGTRAIVLNANFGTYRTCVRSGRGQTCSTHFNLLLGSVTR